MKSIFHYPGQFYIPSAEQGWKAIGSERKARSEYSRLRDIAQKRLKRLRQEGFDAPEDFRKLADINEKNIAFELAKVAQFLRSPKSTVSGVKKTLTKSQLTLLQHGYHINDMRLFGKFMEEWRAQYGRRAYGSEQAAELYESMEHAGMIDEIGESWLSYQEAFMFANEQLGRSKARFESHTDTLAHVREVLGI
jgi:hypothetical protein